MVGMATSQVALWCHPAGSRICSAPAHQPCSPSFSHPSAPNSAPSTDTQLCLHLWLWSIHPRQKSTHTERSCMLWVKGVHHYGQQGSQTQLHLLSWREGCDSLRKQSWWDCLDTTSPFTNQNQGFVWPPGLSYLRDIVPVISLIFYERYCSLPHAQRQIHAARRRSSLQLSCEHRNPQQRDHDEEKHKGVQKKFITAFLKGTSPMNDGGKWGKIREEQQKWGHVQATRILGDFCQRRGWGTSWAGDCICNIMLNNHSQR